MWDVTGLCAWASLLNLLGCSAGMPIPSCCSPTYSPDRPPHPSRLPSPHQVGDHMASLRVLALTLGDVAAAEAYARAHLAPPDYRALLHLVLEPGPGLEPRWDDACYLITALGELEGRLQRV